VHVSVTFNEFQLLELFLRSFEGSNHSVSLDLSGPRHLFYKTAKKWFCRKGLVRSVRSVRHNRTKLLEVPRKSSEALLEQKKQATVLLGLVLLKETARLSCSCCTGTIVRLGKFVCLETVRSVSEKPCAQCCWHPSVL